MTIVKWKMYTTYWLDLLNVMGVPFILMLVMALAITNG